MRWRLQLRKRFHKCAGEKGFSLVEVIVIIVILSIAILPLSRMAISNLDSGRTYSLMTRGTFYAQEIMERIIADYIAGATAGRGYTYVRINWPGTVSSPPTGYTGTVSISGETTVNGVTYVTVTVTVSANGMPNVTLSTWLASGVFP
jgi:Tfp pilus assembly protein PilV